MERSWNQVIMWLLEPDYPGLNDAGCELLYVEISPVKMAQALMGIVSGV